MTKNKKELQNKLDNINKELEQQKKNLIYLLLNIDLEDINLINYHYKFKDLMYKKDYILSELFYLD